MTKRLVKIFPMHQTPYHVVECNRMAQFAWYSKDVDMCRQYQYLGETASARTYASLIYAGFPVCTSNQLYCHGPTMMMPIILQLLESSLLFLCVHPLNLLWRAREENSGAHQAFERRQQMPFERHRHPEKGNMVSALCAPVTWFREGQGNLKGENKSLTIVNVELIDKLKSFLVSASGTNPMKVFSSIIMLLLDLAV